MGFFYVACSFYHCTRFICWSLTCTAVFPYMCFFPYFPGTHNRVNQCPVNELGCLDPDVCIHMSKLCDGVPDCSEGWDEGPHCRRNKHKHKSMHSHTSANSHSLQKHTQKRDSIIIFSISSIAPRQECRPLLWVKNDQPASPCSHLLFFPSQAIISIQ